MDAGASRSKECCQQLAARIIVHGMTFPAIDLSGFDLSRLDPRALYLPFPSDGLLGQERISGVVRDSAYVGVGLALLALQRMQWERRQLAKRLRELTG